MEKYGYITLLATEDYFPGILGVWYSLQKNKSKWPLLVLCTDNLNIDCLKKLEYYGIDYKVVPHKNFSLDDGRWTHCINKFYCLELIDFDKICFLDADCIVEKNIDFLFNSKTPVFNVVHGKIWGGSFVIKPDINFKNYFFDNYDTYFTDEEFINCYFSEKEIYNWDTSAFLFHDDSVIKYWVRYKLNELDKIQNFIDNKMHLLYADLGFHPIPEKMIFSLKGGN